LSGSLFEKGENLAREEKNKEKDLQAPKEEEITKRGRQYDGNKDTNSGCHEWWMRRKGRFPRLQEKNGKIFTTKKGRIQQGGGTKKKEGEGEEG